MEFTKQEVEDIFFLVMDSPHSASKVKILNKIFEVYNACPICAAFYLRSETHSHDDID
jgi:hypothetical protein